jgi:hypothetical protein
MPNRIEQTAEPGIVAVCDSLLHISGQIMAGEGVNGADPFRPAERTDPEREEEEV